jgi:hypothetical protein
VHVDERELRDRKPKKETHMPFTFDPDKVWNEGAKIRSDWSTENWKNSHPRGWIWYDE